MPGYVAGILEDIAGRCSLDTKALFSMAELALLPGDLFGVDVESTPLGQRLAENVPTGPYAMPVLLGQGMEDEIVFETMQSGFVKRLCDGGADLVYRRYEGRDHVSLVAQDSPMIPELIDWTRARFAGETSQPDCALP